ncbi:MAG: protein kinase [Nannocystaceae bacterium]|nr:protein kinase [Nannocystaceae bacterium]
MVDEDSLHPDLAALRGTKVAGRYRVDELLGIGGMGAVFKGRHLGLERDVAIKVLHPELTRDPDISARFDREAHSASRLDHPNCMQVTDVGSTEKGLKFMVMQLLEGHELAEMMGEPYPADRAVLLALQILNGLEHAHDKGVVHRDIKPENIFVTRDHAGRETLKIVDFGIAKLVGASDSSRNMTKAGLVFGTPAYMSPEQAMGQEADARADLYAVGIILWEMLAGEQPFVADDPVALVRMQVSRDAPPLPQSVPMVLDPIVRKLLEKQREARFQTAVEARLALEEILPAIATTDITGITLYPGSSGQRAITGSASLSLNSGPISISGSGPIALTGSGPISVSMPGSGDTSQHLAVTSIPPVDRARNSVAAKWALAGGALAVAVVVGAFAMRGGDDKPAAPEVAAAAGEADFDDEIVIVDDEGPTDSQLAEIDRLILAKKADDADKLLGPLLDRFPDDARLVWRQGRMLIDQGKKKRPQALAAYGKALENNATLIDDRDFYAELAALMRKPGLRDEALDLALRQMGPNAHTFLLELVNNERKPLNYEDRHRALEELETVAANADLVNARLNRALDVLQAHEALTPCGAYLDALDAISSDAEYYYYRRVEQAELPKPKEGKHLTDADKLDAERCGEVVQRREALLAQLAGLEPNSPESGTVGSPVGENGIPTSNGGGTGGSSNGAGKRRKRSPTKRATASKGPDCSKFGAGLINKKCR